MQAKRNRTVGLISKIRNSRVFKVTLAVVIILLTFPYDSLYALTDGPSMPEYSGFQAVKPGEHVDPFSGDFSYSIPLGDVDGQLPLTLSYSSEAVTWESEASWVGLGWNLNTGAIQRTVNSIPDDAKGDEIKRYIKMRPEREIWVGGKFKPELLGLDLGKIGKFLKVGGAIGINNYKGLMVSTKISAQVKVKKPKIGKKQQIEGKADKPLLTPKLTFSSKYTGGKGPEFVVSGQIGLKGKEENAKRGFSSSLSLTVSPSSYAANVGFQFSKKIKSKSENKDERVTWQGVANLLKIGEAFSGIPDYEIRSLFIAANVDLASPIKGYEPKGGLYATYKRYKVVSKEYSTPVYGFLYLHKGQNIKEAILDYMREKGQDVTYIEGKPIHTPTYLSPDLFDISAPGLNLRVVPDRKHWSYVFTPWRSSISEAGDINKPGIKKVVSMVRDALKSFAASLGLEYGMADGIKAGFNISLSTSLDEQGYWKEMAKELPKFRANDVYFKTTSGEIVSTKTLQAYTIKSNSAYSKPIKLKKSGLSKVVPAGDLPPPEELVADPHKQPFAFTVYTVEEAKKIFNSGFSPAAKPHHIGRIEVVNASGIRYVFGKSLYNLGTKEVTFRKNHDDKSKGVPILVSYSTDDASDKNKQGKDHFFEHVTRPTYAYSYLLTEVYSPDYADRAGDGPSDDDLGWWAKYNYTQPYNYVWRAPVDRKKAYYSPGKLIDKKDGTATFTYGDKEISYLQSIESPFTFIEFHTSPRKDGLGVIDKHGGVNYNRSVKLYKLDSISFYQKDPSENKYLYKRVHFLYDYSLAPGTPNSVASGKGRLTLRSVTIVNFDIYGSYETGRQTYNFDYYMTYEGKVVQYEPGKTDRWGIYKPDAKWDNRYATNDTTKRNEAVRLWKLKKITLPSGATIEIHYESDRYTWVQNRRAQMMYKIIGFSKGKTDDPTRYLYKNLMPYLYMHIDAIPDTIQDYAKAKAYADFILSDQTDGKGIDKHLYVKTKVNLKNVGLVGSNNLKDHAYDYVEVFVRFEDYDVVLNNNGKYYLVIKLKPKPLNITTHVNDITWFSIQKAVMEYPSFVYPGISKLMDDMSQKGFKVKSVINSLMNLVGSLISAVGGSGGMRGFLLKSGVGKSVDAKAGYVRLGAPPGGRLGGGARVSRLIYEGKLDGVPQRYVTEYKYYLFEPASEQMSDAVFNLGQPKESLSSGVAAFEPFIGHEENPLMEPLYFSPDGQSVFTLLGFLPTREFFTTEPVMTMAYPNASVGYKNIVVRNVTPSGVIGIGEIYYEYNTYKEFPIVQHYSPIAKGNKTLIRKKQTAIPDFELIPFLALQNALYISQAFYSIDHRMHGKIKKKTVYDGMRQFVSEETYYYKSSLADGGYDSYVEMVNHTGEIKNYHAGLDIDFVVDMGFYNSSTSLASVMANLDVVWLYLFVIPIPFIWANARIKSTKHGFVTTTMKITVNYFVDKVVVRKKNQQGIQGPVVYDYLTGTPLVTKSIVGNQIKDSAYQVQFPAYWFYPELSPIGNQEGRYFDVSTDNAGRITQISFVASKDNVFIAPESSLNDGDQLFDPQAETFYWVAANEIDGKLYMIGKSGQVVKSFSGQLVRTRSGKKNILGIAAATASSIDMPIKNINNKKYLLLDDNSRVFSSALSTFSDHWQVDCNIDPMCVYNSKDNYATVDKVHENYFGYKELYGRGRIYYEIVDANKWEIWGHNGHEFSEVNLHANMVKQTSVNNAQVISFEKLNDTTIIFVYGTPHEYLYQTTRISNFNGYGIDSSYDTIIVVWGKKLSNPLIITPPQNHTINYARVIKDLKTEKIYIVLFHTEVLKANGPCSFNLRFFISAFTYDNTTFNSLSYIGTYELAKTRTVCNPLLSNKMPVSMKALQIGDIAVDKGLIVFTYNFFDNDKTISDYQGKSYYVQSDTATIGIIDVHNSVVMTASKMGLVAVNKIYIDNDKVYILGAKAIQRISKKSNNYFMVDGNNTYLLVYDLTKSEYRIYSITGLAPDIRWYKAFSLIKSNMGIHIVAISNRKGPEVIVTEPINNKHHLSSIKYAKYFLNHGCHSHKLPDNAFSFFTIRPTHGTSEHVYATLLIQGSQAIQELYPQTFKKLLNVKPRNSDYPVFFVNSLWEHWEYGVVANEDPNILIRIPLVNNNGEVLPGIESLLCFSQQERLSLTSRMEAWSSSEKFVYKSHYQFESNSLSVVGSSNVKSFPISYSCGFNMNALQFTIKHPESCCDGEIDISGNSQEIIDNFVYGKNGIYSTPSINGVRDTGLCIGKYTYFVLNPDTCGSKYLIPPGDFVLRYNSTCYGDADGVINPFLEGARGRWMVKDVWTQRLVRAPSDLMHPVDVKQHGYLEDWRSFVRFDGTRVVLDTAGWVRQNTVTRMQPWGEPIEERNILGLYSSALYGYRHKFPVMTAVNARNSQIFFTSFEDSTILTSHLRTVYPLPSDMWTQYRVADGHGGYWSLRITDSFSIGGKWLDQFCEYHDKKHAIPYVVDDCDCNPRFQPKPGESMYYYVWVKWERKDKKVKVCDGVVVDNTVNTGNYSNDEATERVGKNITTNLHGDSRDKGLGQNEKSIGQGQTPTPGGQGIQLSPIKVPVADGAIPIEPKPWWTTGGNGEQPDCQYVLVEAYDTPSIKLTFSSEVLSPVTYDPEWISRPMEGWVLYRFKVDIPERSCGDYMLTLQTNKPVQIDDIRIEPLNSRTRTIVYDWQRLRIVNEFGFNHLGTFYRYDERGNLTTILVETEDGKIGTGHQRSELKK